MYTEGVEWLSVLGGGAGFGGCRDAIEPTLVFFILFCRLCTTLGKGLRASGRGLTQGSENPEKQRVLHMHEGKHGCLCFRSTW